MARSIRYLLYAFAVATVLPMSATTIVLALLVIALFRDLYLKTVSVSDFKKDSWLYVGLFSWKAFTRVLATSLADIPKIKGVWDRVPYLVIGFYRIPREAVLKIFHILFIANAVIIIYALGQHYLGIPYLYKPLFFEMSGRMSGYFGHPNQYAGCIAIVFIMNISVGLYQDRKYLLYAPVLLAGVVLAGSRSYYLGILAAFLGLLVQSKSAKQMLTFTAIAVLICALILIVVPGVQQRVMDIFSMEKNIYRLNNWKISWNIFLEHPVVGVGSGMLPQHLEPFKEKGLIDFTSHAHNMYIHELAEGGIPGFILVIGTQIYFFIKYYMLQNSVSEPLMKAFSLGVSLSLLNLLVAGIFEHNFGAAIVALNINYLMGVIEGYRLPTLSSS